MRKNKGQGKPAEQAQAIDLTPMLDVVFIMLIFFIVTASFIKVPGIDVERAAALSADQLRTAILVAISANDEIWVDKKKVKPEELKLELVRLRTENPKGGLVIQADRDASMETLALVSDVAIDIGLTDIAVSTLPE
ncbi:MAG: biopolymer transporter ExbD [Porticoccaceae bacterium]|nr:MAG: biopolymer transporter ExbD [Porticoccaceae bacterium]